MWFVRLALKNPHAVAVLALLIVLLGLITLPGTPRDILPVFKAPAVQVMTFFSGMPTVAVEKTITNRIERNVGQAAGCQLVESKSMLGVSIVRLYFRDDIDPNSAETRAKGLADNTLKNLPPNTDPPVTLPFDPTGTLPLGMLSVTNPSMSEAQLKDLARFEIRNRILGLPGVDAPVVFGGQDRIILIEVDPLQLEVRNLSQSDVIAALQQGNVMMSPGVARIGISEFQLDSNAMVDKVEDLNSLPLRTKPGNTVYLRDIGKAVDTHTIQTSLVRINGHRQIYIPIYRRQGASTIDVADAVKKVLPDMERRLPGVKLDFVMDQSVYARSAIKSLVDEGIIGAVLVAGMILFFLGNIRMTLIAILSIPLAVLCSITGLRALGMTINVMTLGGLALAIGPLVDNAIVVLENTHRNHRLGRNPMASAYYGAGEVTLPVFVATLTTIIVLCPIALMPGMGGFLFMPLTVALGLAMLCSFLLSQTLVPMLAGYWQRPLLVSLLARFSGGLADALAVFYGIVRDAWDRLHHRIDRLLHSITRQYERLLAAALARRFQVLGGVAGLFIMSVPLVLIIGQEFFPQVDAGQLTMYVRAPSGTNIEETERRIQEVEKFLEDNIPADERKMIIAELGLVPDWSAAYTPNSGSQDAVVKVQLTPQRRLTSQEYAVKLRRLWREDPRYRDRFADLRVSFDTGGMVSAALNYGASTPIDIQIRADERTSQEEAMAVARRIRDRVSRVRGTADVHVAQRLDAPRRFIEVDAQKAADVGLSVRDVISQATTAMNSSVSLLRNFWIDAKSGNQYFVAVRYPENPNLTLEDVRSIIATGSNQNYPISLGELATIRPDVAPVEANHVSLARVFNVRVNTEGRDIGSVAGDIRKVLAGLKVPPGIDIRLMGEYSRMGESFGMLGGGLILATVLVYLVLVVLFRSFLTPLIIMFAVPLGLIGVLWMLFLTGTTLNVQSSMGVIFMVGIVVANSVLLIDFANRQRALGASLHKAIATAAAIRLRPILMTFLATFLALMPMALGLGKGSEANVPLARAVIGGLISSTILTLIVVPILYTLLNIAGRQQGKTVDEELDEPLTV